MLIRHAQCRICIRCRIQRVLIIWHHPRIGISRWRSSRTLKELRGRWGSRRAADGEAAERVIQMLRDKGLDAIAYGSIEALGAALETARFDGFILDWPQDASTIRELLRGLRERHPTAPVIILAGQDGETTTAQDAELERTLATFRAQLYEKTTRPLSLLTALELGFERR